MNKRICERWAFWCTWAALVALSSLSLVAGHGTELRRLRGAYTGCDCLSCEAKTVQFDECSHESMDPGDGCDDVTCQLNAHFYAECPENWSFSECPIGQAIPYISAVGSLREALGELCSPGSVSQDVFLVIIETDCKGPGAYGRCELSGQCFERMELSSGYDGNGPYCYSP